ncbi:MAG: NADH-quinone oxidoreductase subunit N [Armatimonadetes bacterium]|nr:NADH-quinone oxidoreductase subunit N [Armatimonadota bacterium]MBS1710979.1 NADH-quinone oxidoreductase subunit N [Armatimonadota bacterium]MBX3108651.1 NADH-quinone oxidoreductase subunit N [Fimbriimonadaceae bacterium]
MNQVPHIDWLLVLPVLVVIGTGLVALGIEMLRPKQNNNAIVGVSLLGLAAAFAASLGHLGATPKSTFTGMVYRDQFGTLLELVLIGAAALSFLFSEGYLRQRRIAYGEFYPLALWSLSGAMMMVTTQNLLMLFVGLEVLSISLYVLSGMARGDDRSEESALKYFLLGAFASAFLLFGIAFIYGASGRIDLEGFRIASGTGQTMAFFGLGLILVGLGFKAALVPFHQWTPDVYQGAPTNVTAFMSVVSKAAAFGAIVRVLLAAEGLQPLWFPAVSAIAILTMTVGNLVALVQKDAKRALGYSSVAHAGYILVGVLAHAKNPDSVSLSSVVFYLVAYAAMTIGAFAMVSLTAHHGKEGTRTQDLNGMWRKSPYAAGVLFICLISLVGVPPTAGFFGKWAIFNAALSAGLAPLAIALAVNSAISAFYYWQIAKAAFVDDEPALQTEFAPLNGGLKLTGAVCALASLLMAFFASPILAAADSAGRDSQSAIQDPAGTIR